MLNVSIDAATLADAVQKAARIAPTKGDAFDKAAGLLLDVDPVNKKVEIRSTNLSIHYLHSLELVEVGGDMNPVVWRLPSSLIANICTALDLGEGERVTFHDRGDGFVRMVASTTKARFATYDSDAFPHFKRQVGDFSEAHDFGVRAEQVAWAADPGSPRLGGVHVTGKRLEATNGYLLAEVPCEVPVDDAVTVPLTAIASMLSKGSDVRTRVEDRRLMINLDQDAQVQTTVLAEEFPNTDGLKRDNFLGEATVYRDQFVRIIERIFAMSKTERDVSDLKLTFSGSGLLKKLILDIEVPGVGRVQDEVELGGEFSDEFNCYVQPEYFRQAVESSKQPIVTIAFGPDPLKPIRCYDDVGYEVWFQPKQPRSAV